MLRDIRMVENLFPEKRQKFVNVCMGCKTVAWRIKEVSGIKRQLVTKGTELEFFH